MKRALAAVAALALTSAAWAQERTEVQFAKGNFGTMIEGSIEGDAYHDYLLGARGGQELFVELDVTDSTGSGTVYFNILPPGSDGVAIYNGSMDGTSFTQPLPEDGVYTIRVYQMGNDKDAGKTSAFRMDLSIQ
ncbi:hypothetical protein [Litorisediminicola beolgyonensis]|uniref:Inhibitor of g-type lysozyme n=1 Tax=Litorisediminicola beolgyonensis TaxID=1173614 RepID=A0ABW3ZEH5_9RHOB